MCWYIADVSASLNRFHEQICKVQWTNFGAAITIHLPLKLPPPDHIPLCGPWRLLRQSHQFPAIYPEDFAEALLANFHNTHHWIPTFATIWQRAAKIKMGWQKDTFFASIRSIVTLNNFRLPKEPKFSKFTWPIYGRRSMYKHVQVSQKRRPCRDRSIPTSLSLLSKRILVRWWKQQLSSPWSQVSPLCTSIPCKSFLYTDVFQKPGKASIHCCSSKPSVRAAASVFTCQTHPNVDRFMISATRPTQKMAYNNGSDCSFYFHYNQPGRSMAYFIYCCCHQRCDSRNNGRGWTINLTYTEPENGVWNAGSICIDGG